jgi:hypothetical protein
MKREAANAEVAQLLRALASVVEKLGTQELAQLPMQLAHLKRSTVKRRPVRRERMDYQQLQQVVSDLRSLPTRERGNQLLADLNFSRVELTSLARHAQVNVSKTDDVQRIKEKIIEATIGSRLNSRAIRGER